MNKLTELRNKLASIVEQMEGYHAKADDFTNEEIDAVNALDADYNKIKNQIEALEKIENMKASSTVSTKKTVANNVNPAAKVEVGVDNIVRDPKQGFKSMGDFAMAVKGYKTAANPDTRLKRIANSQRTFIGEDGGFLIPDDFRNEIQKKVDSDESLLSLTRQLRTSSNNVTLPTHENASWDNNGVQAYWIGEGKNITESQAEFKQASIKLHKLAAFMTATEEMLEDSVLLESFINSYAPEVIMHKINEAILIGDGSGKPKGILNSGFKYAVAAEGGQAADSVVYENIVKMESRLLPGSYSRSRWIINPAVKEQLRLMKFDSSAPSPVPVYLPPSGLDAAPYGTLMGRPLVPMMGGAKALGDEGDIMLADFSYYTTLLKSSSLKAAMSTHLLFQEDKSAFKFTFRVGGDCVYKSPVQTQFGAYDMSGFVTLQDR